MPGPSARSSARPSINWEAATASAARRAGQSAARGAGPRVGAAGRALWSGAAGARRVYIETRWNFNQERPSRTSGPAGTRCSNALATPGRSRAAGVEVVQTRHEAALRVHAALRELLSDDERSILEAKCALCVGDAFSDSTSAFLASCDVLFVNNASGTMAPERVAGTALDEQLANDAKRCRVGSRLIAMDRIPLLDECNAFRGTVILVGTRRNLDGRARAAVCRQSVISGACAVVNPLMDDYPSSSAGPLRRDAVAPVRTTASACSAAVAATEPDALFLRAVGVSLSRKAARRRRHA